MLYQVTGTQMASLLCCLNTTFFPAKCSKNCYYFSSDHFFEAVWYCCFETGIWSSALQLSMDYLPFSDKRPGDLMSPAIQFSVNLLFGNTSLEEIGTCFPASNRFPQMLVSVLYQSNNCKWQQSLYLGSPALGWIQLSLD